MRRLFLACIALAAACGRGEPASGSATPATAAPSYRASDGSFAIDFPAPPTRSTETVPGHDGPVEVEMASYLDADAARMFAASSYVLPLRGLDPVAALDGIADNTGGGATHAVVTERHPRRFNGLPALEVRLVGSYPGKGEFTQRGRFIIDPKTSRVFVLTVAAQGAIDDAVAERFFGSLKLP